MPTTVPAGDDQLWAEDSGGGVPVVVLLHPGVADARSWDLAWPLLAGQVRLIRYDARGYGKSPHPTASYRQQDDLIAVLDHFGVARAHLVGCSMGGETSVSLALDHADRVSSLTLLCPGFAGYDWPADPEMRAAEDAARAAGEEAIVAMGLRDWAAAGTTPLITDMMRSAVRAWQAQDEFCEPSPQVFGRLGEIGVPTVLMVGDLDQAPLIASNEAAAKVIPGCEFIRLPGVDHLPALREPGLVSRVILRQCGIR